MKNVFSLAAAAYILFLGGAYAETNPPLTIAPDGKPVKISKSNIEISLYQRPENLKHYPTEIRFTRAGKFLFKQTLLSDPTGGYASAEVLGADERFVLLQIGGDETNQLIAFDLKKKAAVFNTGTVNGMGSCELKTLSEKPFCQLWVMCPMPNAEPDDKGAPTLNGISEYLCPDGK